MKGIKIKHMQKTLGILVIVVVAGALVYWGLNQSSDKSTNSSSTNGRVVFAITDAAASLQNVDEVRLQVTQVQVQSANSSWVTVTSTPMEFNLMALKQTGSLALLVDTSLEAGTYNQIRLDVGKVIVVSGSTQTEAKLPSSELKIVGKLVVEAGKTSTLVLDFLLDKSLHVTGNGKYILTPVVKLESKSNASVEVKGDDEVEIKAGKTETDTTVGMDINGEIKNDFEDNEDEKLEILDNGTIHAGTSTESQGAVNITASKAVELAISSGNLDVALSVKLETEDNTKVWKIVGTKGLITKTVRINATTGVIIKAD